MIVKVFFFFLTTSLFLGDGKQPFVDVWWALGIIMMYGVRYYQRGKLDLTPLPRPIGIAWAALILYYTILIPFSDSPGYSITATTRLIEGYLAFVMFSTISSEKTIALFMKGLLGVGAIATLASFVFLPFPTLARLLPPMNLLYATYGHNHLADLLLFVFPVAIGASGWLLALFTVGMILTFARGAWLLLVVYVFFLVFRSKNQKIRKIGLAVAGVIITAFLVVSLGFGPGASQKPSLLQDGRWEYWRQSVEAIKERPLFGSGPGTFYLESKRLQARPNSWSWFAHSFPLQLTVEAGIVGLVLFVGLFFLLLRGFSFSPSQTGVILVIVYGLYEFSLDYIVMWVVLWGALGLFTQRNHQRLQRTSLLPMVLLVMLVLFYFSSISGAVAGATGNNKLAFFLAPYITETTENLLKATKEENSELDGPTSAIIKFFHKANPDVHVNFLNVAAEETQKQEAREKLMSLDPWNANIGNVAEFYLNRKEWDKAAELLRLRQKRWIRAQTKHGYEIDYLNKLALSEEMLRLGDGLYKEKRIVEASDWYKSAQTLDVWALSKHEPIITKFVLPQSEQLAFFHSLLNSMGGGAGRYLGRYRDSYAEAYLSTIKEAVVFTPPKDITEHVKTLVTLFPWKRQEAWQTTGYLIIQKAKREKEEGYYQESYQTLLEAFNVWRVLRTKENQPDWSLRQDLARELVVVGNQLAPEKLLLTSEASVLATSLVPWVFKERSEWFVQYGPEDISYNSLLSYINQGKRDNEWETKNLAKALLFLVQKLINDGRFSEAVRYSEEFKTQAVVDYRERKHVAAQIQQKADEHLQQDKKDDAESLILTMANILPTDYWEQAQTGNFYVFVGDLDKAKRAFRECLVLFGGRHSDCQNGLRSLNAGKPDPTLYEKVSNEIRKTQI